MSQTKSCQTCHKTFGRAKKISMAAWRARVFCSKMCASAARVTHGGKGTRLYKVWKGMKERCLNPNSHSYPNYGGRGITVCAAWRDDYMAFREDMGGDAGREYQLGRIDNDGDYEPGNVRWETPTQNQGNTRTNVMIESGGRSVCLAQYCRESGLNYDLTYARLVKLKWPLEKALERAKRAHVRKR